MTTGLFIALTFIGLAVAGLASVGSKILHEFPSHELEEYCERRQREDRFGEILDGHEQVAIGAESLNVVGVTLFAVGVVLWIFDGVSTNGDLGVTRLSLTILVSIVALLVTTSWIPWTIQRIWAVPMLFHTWPFWLTTSIVAWPMSVGVEVVDGLIRRMAGKPPDAEDDEEAFDDEIRTMVTAGEREGLLEADEREMIEGVLELGDTDVSDIMTPRSNVDAFEIGLDWEKVLRFAVKVGRTRIPVYREKLEDIVGVLFVKDLLLELASPEQDQRRPIEDLLRTPWFVPKTKPVDDLLQEFLNTRSHLAIVLDEYESVAGVVTIEDVLEEIVGEIVDETDRDEVEEITTIDKSTAEALGTAHIDELNEKLGLDLPESDDYDTVAGFVLEYLGHIPGAGESIEHGNVRIAVLDASRRQIERVRIEVFEKANGK